MDTSAPVTIPRQSRGISVGIVRVCIPHQTTTYAIANSVSTTPKSHEPQGFKSSTLKNAKAGGFEKKPPKNAISGHFMPSV